METIKKQKYTSVLFIITTLGLFYYLFYSSFQLQKISIDLKTTQMGTVRIFWAGENEPFSRSHSTVKRIPKGHRQYDFLIQNPDRIYRLKVAPSFYHSYVSIYKIRIDSPKFHYQPVKYPDYSSRTSIQSGIDNVEMSDYLKFRIADHGPALGIDLEELGNKALKSVLIISISLCCLTLLVLLAGWWNVHHKPGFRLFLFVSTILTAWVMIHFNSVWVFRQSTVMVILMPLMIALVIADLPFLITAKLSKIHLLENHGKLLFASLVVIGVFWVAWYSIPLGYSIISKYENGPLPKNKEGKENAIPNLPEYFDKQFVKKIPYRKDLLYLNALIKLFGFGYSPTSKVLLGKDNYFFEGYGDRRVEGDVIKSYDNVSDYIGAIPFSDTDLEIWGKTLKEREEWLKKKGIPYLFVLAPTKAQIYPEKLPIALQNAKRRRGKPNRYDQLVQYLNENTIIPFVDLRMALLNAKKIRNYPPLYYRTDFHWNFYGAFYAYQEIIRQIDQSFPDIALSPMQYEDFDLNVNTAWAHPTFLKMVGLEPQKYRFDHYFSLIPQKGTLLAELGLIPQMGVSDIQLPKIKLKNAGGTHFDIINIQNPKGKLKNILILGDSFIEKTLLYFSAHAQNTMYIRAIDQFPLSVYEHVQPDIVIQEILNMYILRNPPENPYEFKKLS